MTETSGFDIAWLSEPDTALIQVNGEIYSSPRGPFRIMECTYFSRRVAMKCLKEEFVQSKAHLNLLRREGALMSTLHHPSIVKYFAMVTTPQTGPGIVMEYVEGETLLSYLARSGPLPFNEVRKIMGALCEATEYLHSAGVIHRDLKPSNILIRESGDAIVLIDFGLAHGTSFNDRPLPGGTRGFSAPEQLDESVVPSPTADVWSIGKIMEAMQPSEANPKSSVLQSWNDTRDACLQEDPSLRPASGGKVMELLNAKSAIYQRRVLVRRRMVYVAATALLCVMLGSLLYLTIGREEHESRNIPVDLSTPTVNILPMAKADALNVPSDSISDPVQVNALEESDSPEVIPESVDSIESGGAGLSEISDYRYDIPNPSSFVGVGWTTNLDVVNDPVAQELVVFVRPVIKKHYSWQLNLLKTLTTPDEANLALINHWHFKVYSEIADWVEKRRKGKNWNWEYPIELCQLGCEELTVFVKTHEQEELAAKQDMVRRTHFGLTDHWTEPVPGRPDLMIVHELSQSGEWDEYVRAAPMKP